MKKGNELTEAMMRLKYSQETPEPFYVFDEDALAENIGQIQGRLMPDMEMCYAVKANPLLVQLMKDGVSRFEACSPGEADICCAYGTDMKKVVYSGVNKQPADIRAAFDHGVGIITAESVRQFEWICEAAAGQKKGNVMQVLLRLSNGAQFGMDTEDLKGIIAEYGNNDSCGIHIAGIQYFTGTQKKIAKTDEEIDLLFDFAAELGKEYGFKPEILEYGPGLKVPYFQGEDFDSVYTDLETVVKHTEERNKQLPDPAHIVFEMGRFIAASCGSYCAQVMDTKRSGGRNYAILDGGINHINYYGQNMAMRLPVMVHCQTAPNAERHGAREEWCLCGSLCTFADVLARKAVFTDLACGDLLIFRNIGAYSVTEGIYLFLSHEMPEIYFYSSEKGMRMIRPAVGTSAINAGMISGDRKEIR